MYKKNNLTNKLRLIGLGHNFVGVHSVAKCKKKVEIHVLCSSYGTHRSLLTKQCVLPFKEKETSHLQRRLYSVSDSSMTTIDYAEFDENEIHLVLINSMVYKYLSV